MIRGGCGLRLCCGCRWGYSGLAAPLVARQPAGEGPRTAPIRSAAAAARGYDGSEHVYVSRRFMLETRNICQDRLGTNIGEIQQQDSSFFLRL
jgi:hypothetical protein